MVNFAKINCPILTIQIERINHDHYSYFSPQKFNICQKYFRISACINYVIASRNPLRHWHDFPYESTKKKLHYLPSYFYTLLLCAQYNYFIWQQWKQFAKKKSHSIHFWKLNLKSQALVVDRTTYLIVWQWNGLLKVDPCHHLTAWRCRQRTIVRVIVNEIVADKVA